MRRILQGFGYQSVPYGTDGLQVRKENASIIDGRFLGRDNFD
jgi:hypothetical protein